MVAVAQATSAARATPTRVLLCNSLLLLLLLPALPRLQNSSNGCRTIILLDSMLISFIPVATAAASSNPIDVGGGVSSSIRSLRSRRPGRPAATATACRRCLCAPRSVHPLLRRARRAHLREVLLVAEEVEQWRHAPCVARRQRGVQRRPQVRVVKIERNVHTRIQRG